MRYTGEEARPGGEEARPDGEMARSGSEEARYTAEPAPMIFNSISTPPPIKLQPAHISASTAEVSEFVFKRTSETLEVMEDDNDRGRAGLRV